MSSMTLSSGMTIDGNTMQVNNGVILTSSTSPISRPIADVDYAALSSDQVIAYTSLTAARTVTLTPCGNPINLKFWQIKDKSGNCSVSKPINLASTSGTFDGLTSTAVSTPCGSKTFYDDGTNFFMCGMFMPSVNASGSIQKADGNGGFLNAVSGTDYVAPSGIGRATSALSLSLVGIGATGTQISATKDSSVSITANCSATVSALVGGATSTSTITLKKCATNSITESDWVGPLFSSGVTLTAALTVNSSQPLSGQLNLDIPAGWFAKAVASGAGTHSETLGYQEKTIYG